MKGLDLARGYYEDVVRPAVSLEFGERFSRMAFGLVGEGSECYGFDDEISQDHDFGPRVQIWLTREDYADFGERLQRFLGTVSKDYAGYRGVNVSQYGEGREGVFTVGGFYARFIGFERVPETIQEWRRLPEVNLSIATNGEVFFDGPGAFSALRESLLAFYPEPLRIKKMAARCMKMAQSGQYNFSRCLRRGERVGAALAKAEFVQTAGSMLFLMNRRYCPFYKWMHRGLRELPLLGAEAAALMEEIVTGDEWTAGQRIEALSALIIEELQREGLTNSRSDFLLDHGPELQARVEDEGLRRLPVFAE
jgi:hypothetical protein